MLSLPFALRFRLANDHRLLSAVLGACLGAILAFQRERARTHLGVSGRCGAVTAVQRFGGGLNLNVHFHAIVLDGVHVEDASGCLVFHALPRPTAEEQRVLTERVACRVRATAASGRSAVDWRPCERSLGTIGSIRASWTRCSR